MIQKVELDGVKLPRLYIAENHEDARLCIEKGIPFVRWTEGKEALIKMLLRPVLERKFPYIKWDSVLGKKPPAFKTKIEIVHSSNSTTPEEDKPTTTGTTSNETNENEADPEPDIKTNEDGSETATISENERIIGDGGDTPVTMYSIEQYMQDSTARVDLEVLQQLRLMPAFIGDILDCIKLNIGSGIYWREGYNKKRGLPVGRFDAARQKPNLIILDVSASIPRGIAATMITLIDTLRTQLNADLIITANKSRYYSMTDKLPTPQQIRQQFRPDNETREFLDILQTRIKGRHYGHVISFGDNDTPRYYLMDDNPLIGTMVDKVHHYHTGLWGCTINGTGYARWCDLLEKKPESEVNTDWCKVIEKEDWQ